MTVPGAEMSADEHAVLAIIERLEALPGERYGAAWEDVVGECGHLVVPIVDVESVLNQLMDRALIYEPLLGRLRSTRTTRLNGEPVPSRSRRARRQPREGAGSPAPVAGPPPSVEQVEQAARVLEAALASRRTRGRAAAVLQVRRMARRVLFPEGE